MKITKEVIENVANLARLNLTEEDKVKLTSDMAEIITFMDKLNELDTSEVKPMEHVIPIQNVLRGDVKKESYERKKILDNAPSSGEGCFKVPKVVE